MTNNFKKTYQKYYQQSETILVLLKKTAAGVLPPAFIFIIMSGLKWGLIFTLFTAIFYCRRLITQERHTAEVSSRFFPLVRTPLFYNLAVTFYTLGYLAKAKGQVRRGDIAYAEYLMQQFNVDAAARALLIRVFNQGKNGDYPLSAVVGEFTRIFCREQRVLSYFFDYQLLAALQDGQLQEPELAVLRILAQEIGMSAELWRQKIASAEAGYKFRGQGGSGQNTVVADIDSAYRILGISADEEQTAVKKAYRNLIQQYHPDKFAAKKVPAAVLKQVEQKSQEIIAAYNLICQAKGWKK